MSSSRGDVKAVRLGWGRVFTSLLLALCASPVLTASAYVETYHHRPHSGLGYRTPKEVRKTWQDAQESEAPTNSRGLG